MRCRQLKRQQKRVNPGLSRSQISNKKIWTLCSKTRSYGLKKYEEPVPNENPSLEESYRNFRTNLVLSWILTNVVIALAITIQQSGRYCPE
ncbi:hypothetical protein V1525DRAFT_67516 [Lipomyces kononenkoae]|uniref:Uncharacterized protein n=1 Tax=Lipomyces kononenkoae TaxID=34357 RepID=A0ACC3ST49_LIPKO